MFDWPRRRRLQNELSDEELQRAVLAGSSEAMAELYRRHGGLVYRFTLQMSRNEAVAEEITQEVFLALLTQFDRFDSERATLSTWLCGIARRQLWKHLRSDSSAEQEFDGESAEQWQCPSDGPAEHLLRDEAVRLVREGMDGLPTALREVIVLCALEEMSYDEAAQVLAVPVGTVRSRLHRAKARLAALVRGEVVNTERKRGCQPIVK